MAYFISIEFIRKEFIMSSSHSSKKMQSIPSSLKTPSAQAIKTLKTLHSSSPVTPTTALSTPNQVSPTQSVEHVSAVTEIPASLSNELTVGWNQIKNVLIEVKKQNLEPHLARQKVYELTLISAFHMPLEIARPLIPEFHRLVQTQPEIRAFLDTHLGKASFDFILEENSKIEQK